MNLEKSIFQKIAKESAVILLMFIAMMDRTIELLVVVSTLYPTVLRIHFHAKRLVEIREPELVKLIFFIHGHLLEVQGFFSNHPIFLTLLLYYEMPKYSVIETFFSIKILAEQTLVKYSWEEIISRVS